MTESHVAPILTVLLDYPDGMTAKQLASRFNWRVTKASLLLGRMFFAGHLDRKGGVGPARMNNEYTYTISPLEPVQAPPRGTWKPPVLRIAKHPRAGIIAALAAAADELTAEADQLLEHLEP